LKKKIKLINPFLLVKKNKKKIAETKNVNARITKKIQKKTDKNRKKKEKKRQCLFVLVTN